MPQVIGAAILEAFGASAATAAATAVTIAGTAVSYATLVGYTVMVGASIAYSANQNAKLRNSLKNLGADGGRDVMVRDPLASRRCIYGQVPVSGTIVFMATTGTKNDTLHCVVALAGHECQELGDILFDGPNGPETVPLDGTGTNGGGNATGKYAGVFFCNKHLGTASQGYDATLVAATGLWTSAHKLLGIAYLYCQFKYNADLYPNGMPTVRCMVKGKKLRDPRVTDYMKVCSVTSGNENIGCSDLTGLTTGMYVIGPGIPYGAQINSIGSGTFHIDAPPTLSTDPVTLLICPKSWSANSALCAADYLWDPIFGKGVSWSRIDTTSLPAEANICEETVGLLGGGSELRYKTNGTATADQDAFPDILASMAGRVTETGGTYRVLAGAYRTPTAPTFTDDDLVGPFQLQPRQSMRSVYSGVKGTYISPDNQWQPADFPPISNATYVANDGGRLRWKDVAYAFVTSTATSQRLATIDLNRGRLQMVVTATYKLKAFQLACCDTIKITRAALGWTDKLFDVLSWSFQMVNDGANGMFLAVSITAQETDPSAWNWVDGSENTVTSSPTSLPDPSKVPTVSGLTLTNVGILQNDGTFVPRVQLDWNTPNNIYVEQGGVTITEYKKHSDSVWITWNRVRGDVLRDFLTDVNVGDVIDVRAIHQNQIGARSNNNGSATAPDYQTVTSFTVGGDTTNPATPTGLTAATGTGKVVVLTWNPNSDVDILGYRIYRNTVNNLGTATLLAFIAATKFIDVNVSLGTQYFYWLYAVDDSNNQSSSAAGSVNATPNGIATGGSVTSPTASTKTGEGNYTATDGSVYAYMEFTIKALPAGAVGQNLLMKKSSDSQWIIMGEYYNSSDLTGVRVPDLSPGVAYDFAVQAWNSFGDVSSVVTFTSSPFTAPAAATPPPDYTGTSLIQYEKAPVQISSGVRRYSILWMWAEAMGDTYAYPSDFDHWEVKGTATNSTAATDYNVDNGSGSPGLYKVKTPQIGFFTDTPVTTHLSVRAVNASGIAASNWYHVATVAVNQRPFGDAVNKNVGTSSGTVAAGDDSRIVNAVPNTRTVNGKQLNANVTLAKGDIANLGDSDSPTFDSPVVNNLKVGGAVGDVRGIKYAGGTTNFIAFYWDGSNVRAVVDGTLQGTIPNP